MWKEAFSKCAYYRCLCEGPSLPSAVAGPCLWAASRWKGKRCTAWQKHTTAASFCDLPRPSAASPGPLSPRWRRTGSGLSDGRCCGCCWAPVRPSSRWSCSGRCGIRPGVPSSLCTPLPLSHQIPPRWTTGLTSWSMRNAPCRIAKWTRCFILRNGWRLSDPCQKFMWSVSECRCRPWLCSLGRVRCQQYDGSWRRMLLHTEPSPPAPSARRCLRLFSILLASRSCGCERGGSWRGMEGGSGRGALLDDEGEESGVSFLSFFFSFDRSGRWPLPACRAAHAGGSWPRSWTQS